MTASPERTKIIGRIADHLLARRLGHPLRVGIDGVTAAGKTTLAAELAVAVQARGRIPIRLSMDGFHNSRAHRHRQGRNSAIGYYQDAYDFAAFARLVLRPLGPGGDGAYQPEILDLDSDLPVAPTRVPADPDAILIVDGTFLQCGELRGLWDEVVFLDTTLELAKARGSRRDADLFGDVAAAERAFDERYHAACRIYLSEQKPSTTASIVLGNDDIAHPSYRRVGGTDRDTVALFSYGTLQIPQVQLAQFGRPLDGVPAELSGYQSDWLTVTDPDVIATSGTDIHPVVRPSTQPDAAVAGTVFTISPADLAAADLYEVEGYRRHLVRLSTGTDAWVYLAGSA